MLVRSDVNATLLRDAFFTAQTRRMGELAERLVAACYPAELSGARHYDLRDFDGARVEVKFSLAQRKYQTRFSKNTLPEVLAEAASSASRGIAYVDRRQAVFDSNIQQVKPLEFDVLVYGLVFTDLLLLFKAPAAQVPLLPGYSDKQHKGNVGEGQFHLKPGNLDWHESHHAWLRLTFQQALVCLLSA